MLLDKAVERTEEVPENVIDFKVEGNCNVDKETIIGNVTRNIRLQFPQIRPYPPQRPYEQEICIIGGGYSLAENLQTLRELSWKGIPTLALNGAANWCIANGVRVKIFMMLDALPQNIAFVEEPIWDCKYFLASQCDTSVFDRVKDRDTTIFHIATYEEEETEILNAYYSKKVGFVPGGCTVGLRSIYLAYLLGFRRFHMFGFDGCYSPEGEHHGYAQEWNSGEGNSEFYATLKNPDGADGILKFRCAWWMALQAQQFVKMIKEQGHLFRFEIYGDGLLASILRTGAELSTSKIEET